ncbi:MAG: CHASE2 domain-containing protein [Helicobacteraceae bacterium]|nr:CHASE2 domain-containing protein [Helicobacteraceae bacterium]
MNKHLKKFLIYFIMSFILSITLIGVYLKLPEALNTINNNMRDFMFITRGEIPQSDKVVIVDLDNKSLEEIGQWPWSRNVVAELLKNLTIAGAEVIGFDIVFAEPDRSSPHKVLGDLGYDISEAANYDEYFAYIVENTPTILGYQFELEESDILKTDPPINKTLFIDRPAEDENGNPIEGINSETTNFIEAYGVITNIPIVQDVANSSGFFNNSPDEGGIVRSVPLMIRYEEVVYPSLVLEIIKQVSEARFIYLDYGIKGLKSVDVGDYSIPTDVFGRALINYRGKEKTFKYIPAVDILRGEFKEEDINGKIILIGTSAAGLLDLRAMPFEAVYPGVEVHANMIDNILVGDFLSKPAEVELLNIIHIILIIFLTTFALAYLPILLIPFVLAMFIGGDLYGLYYMLFTEGLVLNILMPLISFASAAVTLILINYFFISKNEKKIKDKFSAKVSKEVMESLLDTEGDAFAAMDKEITVFFSDVRGFTNISEAMPNAHALIKFLNKYMDPMTEIIIDKQGTIDKYIGDAIMAYWNAPGNVEDHATKALDATIEQIDYLDILNVELAKEGLPFIDIGIGLNTGSAVVGEMGSQRRSDYTVIGDTINLGARLEALCKSYGARIIISSYTKDLLTKEYNIRNLDLVRVKGKQEPVEIFEVYNHNLNSEALRDELFNFNIAVDLYRKSNFVEALAIFKKMNADENKHNLKIYDTYIERCEAYIEHPPENFDGVFTHTTKG